MSVITIEKVSYGITFPDLKFGNVRPGVVEATPKPGKTLEDALDELDDRLNAWHRKRYPHLYQEIHDGFVQDANYKVPSSTLTTTPNSGPMIINLQHEKLEIAIDNASTFEELIAVEVLVADSTEQIKQQYYKKGIQLSDTLHRLKLFKTVSQTDAILYDAYCSRLKELSV